MTHPGGGAGTGPGGGSGPGRLTLGPPPWWTTTAEEWFAALEGLAAVIDRPEVQAALAIRRRSS